MTIHIVGTSHVLPFRQFLVHTGKNIGFKWYFSNNSNYPEGDFIWTADGLSHTAESVSGVWAKMSGRRSIPIHSSDTVVAFGFDDRFDRYAFLAGKADHVSSACRSQTLEDLVAASAALRMIALVRENQPEAKLVMVEPPLLSRSEQVKKFIDGLVLKQRLQELCNQHAAIAMRYGAIYTRQSVETLRVEGDYLYTCDEYLAADGFHWGPSGIDVVFRDMMPALSLL
ncbi:hypothetical protein [Mesorhizobium sp. CN2-181]|uniref:hypothetical protein n=1 Tax=Mesorhizobium yinganensis TaxID=3157707 RepID=UPI0032B85EFC